MKYSCPSRIWLILLTLAAFVIVLASVGAAQASWSTFTSREGQFSVSVPQQPVLETETVNIRGIRIQNHKFTVAAEDTALIVSYSDYPLNLLKGVSWDKFLDGARDGAVANTHGKLLSELIVKLDGYPGREYRVQLADGFVLHARIYLVKARLYQVAVGTTNQKAFREEVFSFLDSFRLLLK